jgi:HSP20 family protein
MKENPMFLVPIPSRSRAVARSLDRWFDEAIDRALSASRVERAPRAPALDVAETDTEYTVSLDLPGVSREQVNVAIDGRKVTIDARSESSDEKKDGDRIVWRERSDTSYARSFVLPADIDGAASSAKLEHGVLKLSLVKRAPKTAAKIAVN